MANSIKIRHHSIISYVKNKATLLNTFFLLLHISFGFFFKANDIDILFYYNFISIAVYLSGYVILYKNINDVYSTLSTFEVYVFMILATLCLGWDYGFQQYCIIFVVSLLFTDYCLGQEHKLQNSTLGILMLCVFTYFFLRLWTYLNPYVYRLKTDTPERIFCLVNNLITFSFVISYSYLYSQTVYRLEETLVEVATKDALTGLYNRRKMQDLLKAMSEILVSTNPHMCIAMIDIDDFKHINDTYGHDAGDEVLKTVASVLLNKGADKDSFYSCRWGGEEFLVFYRTEQSNEEIIREFDALRQQIADTGVIINDHEISVTITMGLTFYQENLSMNEMVKLADKNLYEGKANGKNILIVK